jgi:hypothetical protein
MKNIGLIFFLFLNYLMCYGQDDLNMGTKKIIFTDGGVGGLNLITSSKASTYQGEWLFNTDYSYIKFNAGINSANAQYISFNIGGVNKMTLNNDILNLGITSIKAFDRGPGGYNVISNNPTSEPTIGEWRFKSDYSNIILDAGDSPSNPRSILFNIGGVNKLSLSNDILNMGITSIKTFDRGPGGYNVISNNPTSEPTIGEWKFKSDYSNIILDAGDSPANSRAILFNIGGTTQAKITTGLFNVCGSLRANEVKVDLTGCDFVFEKDYELMPLNELEKFVKEQKHLPEIAPAKEMEKNGTDLGNLNSKLLQKIEELTLYTIEQNKKLELQNTKIEEQSQELKALKEKIAKIETTSK